MIIVEGAPGAELARPLHKEYHEQTYARQGGPFQMVQLWVNLPAMFDARLNEAGKVEFSFPARQTAAVLVMKGELTLNDTKVTTNDFVLFKNAGERVTVRANSDAQLLVLNGEPIGEPIVQHGPFCHEHARRDRSSSC